MTSLNNPLTGVSKMNVDELLIVFKTLKAPDLAEMNGEYPAIKTRKISINFNVSDVVPMAALN